MERYLERCREMQRDVERCREMEICRQVETGGERDMMQRDGEDEEIWRYMDRDGEI